jgi:hypothetical protein
VIITTCNAQNLSLLSRLAMSYHFVMSEYPSTADAHELRFYYNDQPVGAFKPGITPTSPGTYEYEPFRGPGHYEMVIAVKKGDCPQCCFHHQGHHVTFKVIATQTNAVLLECFDDLSTL